jgi:signal transduction histidine kinase
MPINQFELQLKRLCQLTGMQWAVWIEKNEDWSICASSLPSQIQKAEILELLRHSEVNNWVGASLAGERYRSRTIRSLSKLGCRKAYVFPNPKTKGGVLVGGDELSASAVNFWSAFVLGDDRRYGSDIRGMDSKLKPETRIPFHAPEALGQALELIASSCGSVAGWLAIRSGDYLELKTTLNRPAGKIDRISIEANPILRQIFEQKRSTIVMKNDVDWAMVPRAGYTARATCWAAIPIIMGQRVIALAGLWLKQQPGTEVLARINQTASSVASTVEGSIVFEELTGLLQRMAYLNDFAVSISSAVDVSQIIQRLFSLLQRIFDTSKVVLLSHSLTGDGYDKYSIQNDSIKIQILTADQTARSWPLDASELLRIDYLDSENTWLPFYSGSCSALIVPLKFRQQVIGALSLEHNRRNAFSADDEHLLAVIASHLAGLLENGRLKQDAEARARNVSLIHDVVEQVIGLTDVEQVAQIASELIAKNFSFELVGIALIDPNNDLTIAGLGGSAADIARQYLVNPSSRTRKGIVGKVLDSGKNILVTDVTEDPTYTPIPGWDAGSEMCVALRDGGNPLGVIDVESQRKNAFNMTDMLVLESLAGILSSVISNAGQYQRLQTTIKDLQTARQELQERITAQHSAEARLVQAAKLAAVGEMAAGIAHELNNPLTTVSGFTELILDSAPENDPVRADLELVLKEAQRARGVVRRLLDFARQSESVRTKCDLNEIVTDVLALTKHLLHTSAIMLQTRLTSGLPWIAVDRNQMKQVVLNLVHNAMHAMPTGGNLSIITANRQRGGKKGVLIQLRDTGTGISKENLERVFDPFFTTRSKEGGTGLGLSVSYGIVVDHGGDIEVESEVGKGSTFSVWLPCEVN